MTKLLTVDHLLVQIINGGFRDVFVTGRLPMVGSDSLGAKVQVVVGWPHPLLGHPLVGVFGDHCFVVEVVLRRAYVHVINRNGNAISIMACDVMRVRVMEVILYSRVML